MSQESASKGTKIDNEVCTRPMQSRKDPQFAQKGTEI